MEVLVTRKGQVTIPIKLRPKYGINKGNRVIFEDSPAGIHIKVIPRFQDLIGIDAGKISSKEALKELDKMRAEDRY